MTPKAWLLFLLFTSVQMAKAQYQYPYSKKADSSSSWHNITVNDPYRWLEDLKNPEVLHWFTAQATFTDSMMSNMPFTEEIYKELVESDIAAPERKFSVRRLGNSLFYGQFTGREGKLKLYRKFDNTDTATLIAAAENWGPNYHITDYQFDPTGQYICMVAQDGGNELNKAKIYSIAQNKFLPDIINGNYKGLVYNQPGYVYYWQTPSYDPHVYNDPNDYVFKKHKIGTDSSEDKIWVDKESHPELIDFSDGNYLWEITSYQQCPYEFAWVVQTSTTGIWYRKSFTNDKWEKLFGAEDQVTSINYYNNTIYYTSYKNAPNGILMQLDLTAPDATRKTIIPEQADPLDYNSIAQTKNYLIISFTKNGVKTYSRLITLKTNKITNSPFREHTSKTRYFPLNAQQNDSVLIAREDWAYPAFVMNAKIGSPKEIPNPYYAAPKTVYKDSFVVEELEVPGYDGTLIPLTIIHRKNIKLNGNNVAIVHGYGAYGDSYPVAYDQNSMLLASKAVVICIAHVRGGGEKGNNWHIGGLKQSKPNSWKDLNSCAEYLIEKGYTSKEHLACTSASAGGILIGRAITERPDLWACAIPEAGVLNTVRGEFSAYGKSQNDEFGDLDNINDFFSMLETDAVLHVQNGVNYPAMLVITGWEDPRVSSWHSGKFVAAAQNASAAARPVLLKVNFKGGHNGDATTDKATNFKEQAKKMAFILWQCDYEHANK